MLADYPSANTAIQATLVKQLHCAGLRMYGSRSYDKQSWTCGEPVSFLLSIWRPAVVRNRASSEGVRVIEVMLGARPSTVACHTRLNRRLSASRSKMLTLPLLHPRCKALQSHCKLFAHDDTLIPGRGNQALRSLPGLNDCGCPV